MAEKRKYHRTLVVFVGALVFFLITGFALKSTSSMDFCSSACHEMNVHAEELRYSPHAKDADGKVIACAQCHIPVGYGPAYLAVKTYSGLKDLYIHVAEAPESLNRSMLQPAARRFVDDDNCLACHADLYKDAKGEKPVSDLGKLAHDAYLGKNGKTKSGCAGCHVNMAHLPEFDRRLDVNKEFAERIQKREALRQ